MTSIQSVAPRYIRSETMMYQDAVIRQLDRINELEIDVGRNIGYDSVLAYELAVRGFHSLLYPTYTHNKYEIAFKKIEEELDSKVMYRSVASKISRFEYIKLLQQWKGLLISEFSQIDILPASKKDLRMTDEPEEEEEAD